MIACNFRFIYSNRRNTSVRQSECLSVCLSADSRLPTPSSHLGTRNFYGLSDTAFDSGVARSWYTQMKRIILIYSIEIFRLVIEIPYSYHLKCLPSLKQRSRQICAFRLYIVWCRLPYTVYTVHRMYSRLIRAFALRFAAIFYRSCKRKGQKSKMEMYIKSENVRIFLLWRKGRTWRRLITANSRHVNGIRQHRKFDFGLVNAKGWEHSNWCGLMFYECSAAIR